MSKSLEISGATRVTSWEKGWNENLLYLKNHQNDALIPKYHDKYPYVRFKQKFYKSDKGTELFFPHALLLNEIGNVLLIFHLEKLLNSGVGQRKIFYLFIQKYQSWYL